MVEKERKNVLVLRNHTDRCVPFINIRHVAAKKIVAFDPKPVGTLRNRMFNISTIGFHRYSCMDLTWTPPLH